MALRDIHERMFGHLRRHGNISRKEAAELLIPTPEARIRELKEAGYLISTVRHTDSSGRVEVRYYLRGGL